MKKWKTRPLSECGGIKLKGRTAMCLDPYGTYYFDKMLSGSLYTIENYILSSNRIAMVKMKEIDRMYAACRFVLLERNYDIKQIEII